MKKVLSLLVALALPLAVFAAAGSNIEFNGVVVETGGKTKVSLLNLSTGESAWVAVGGKFGGFTVSSYNVADAKANRTTDTVVLTPSNGGRSLTQTVPLKNSIILSEDGNSSAPTGPLTSEQRRSIINNLRQLAAGADQFFLENGVTQVTYEQLVGTGPDKFVKPFTPVAGESYSGLVITPGGRISVTAPGNTVVTYSP